jgi:hypothetical protein
MVKRSSELCMVARGEKRELLKESEEGDGSTASRRPVSVLLAWPSARYTGPLSLTDSKVSHSRRNLSSASVSSDLQLPLIDCTPCSATDVSLSE